MKTNGHLVLEPSTDPTQPPGSLTWRLPTGRAYTTRPDPMIIDRRLIPPPPPPPSRPIHTDPDEPPPSERN